LGKPTTRHRVQLKTTKRHKGSLAYGASGLAFAVRATGNRPQATGQEGKQGLQRPEAKVLNKSKNKTNKQMQSPLEGVNLNCLLNKLEPLS